MSSRFSLEAILTLNDQLTGPYKQTTRKVSMLSRNTTNSIARMNAGINRSLKRVITGGLVAVSAGIALATREFISLDNSITQAGAKFKDLDVTSQTYAATLKQLSTAAREVGSVTEFTATDAAGALDKFAMAGFTSAQAMALLRGTTDLATAAGTDLTTAVDIATDSLGAFNLVTEDTVQLGENLTRVSDVMAKTTTTANTSLEEMFESVKTGAPAFTAAGQSVESFAALTGILANSGIKGAVAGTNLRNVMLKLSKPTGEAADVLKSLGVETQDSAGNFRDVVDIIGDFESGLRGMGTAQRTAALTTVFGARAVTGMNVLLAEGSDSLRSYRDQLINSGGASKTMAEAMRQSLGNRLKLIKSGLTEVGLKFIEAFEDKGRGALDKLILGIQNFDVQPIVDGVVRVFEIIEEWGPIILELAPTILAVAAAIKLWAIAQAALNLAQSASPLGLFIASVAAFVILMKTLEKKFGTDVPDAPGKFGGGLFSRDIERGIQGRSGRGDEPSRAKAIDIQRVIEEHNQRNDVFLHAPMGGGLSTTPGGSPQTAVQLGAQ